MNRSSGAEHRLIREIDDSLGIAEPVEQRYAVPLPRPQLLAAARHDRPDPLVGQLDERTPHHVGCMLAVDQGHRSHRRTRYLVLDPRGVLLVLERLEVELDDPLLAVERVAPPDGDVRAADLDHVVTGARLPPEPERRDGAGVHDEEVLEPPRIRNVLVPGKDEVHTRALQALDRVARVVDDVALAAGAGHGQQVVVEHEDAHARGPGELLLDPAVAAAADLAVVEVGLGRVDRDDGDAVLAEHRVALAEELLEMDVADVPRVVVPRDHDERLARRAGRGSASPGRTPP